MTTRTLIWVFAGVHMPDGTLSDIAATIIWYLNKEEQRIYLDPVVQSAVSLTSSFVINLLTVLESTIFNSQVYFLKKNMSSFCKSYSHFFKQKY